MNSFTRLSQTQRDFINKTLIFITNSIFINIFGQVFGMEHIMIAVCIVVIALTLVVVDMKAEIFKRTTLITVALATLCIGATIAATNPLLGFFVNLVLIFGIVYQTLDSFQTPIYFPFVLSYIFMLMSSPISYEQLPMRLLGLVIGCSYILGAQLILNKGRFHKTITGTRQGMFAIFENQVNLLAQGKPQPDLDAQFAQLVQPVMQALYDARVSKKYLAADKQAIFQQTLGFEQLYHTFKNAQAQPPSAAAIESIQSLLSLLNRFYATTDAKLQHELQSELLAHHATLATQHPEFAACFTTIIEYLPTIEQDTQNRWSWREFVANSVKKIVWQNFECKFAFKLAITVSIVIGVSDLFGLTYGRWIVFPLIAIIQPYADQTVTKAKNRIIGTVIGTIFFVMLFSFITDPVARVNLTIFAAYIGTFVKKYQYSTAIVAISALGSSAAFGPEILVYRIGYTIIGCALALFVNRYILHYNLAKAKVDLGQTIAEIDAELATMPEQQTSERTHLLIKQKLMQFKLAN